MWKAIQLRVDLAHGLGSSSRCTNDVLGSSTAITSQLPRWAIHGLVGGSDGMDSGRGFLHDAKIVMGDLGQNG